MSKEWTPTGKHMLVDFRDSNLKRLYHDPGFNAGLPVNVVRAYRKRMNFILAAKDERDLYLFGAQEFKKLQGARLRQRSMRLNDRWRLIMVLDKSGPQTRAIIEGIEK
jgi:proteic killer suppression protein